MKISPADVRRVLGEVLRTAADFDAFCIDYLPEVAPRFSDEMDRVARTNLILRLLHADQVIARLQPAFPDKIRQVLATPRPQGTDDGRGAISGELPHRALARRRLPVQQGVPLCRPVLTVELRTGHGGELDVAYLLHHGGDLSAEPEELAVAEPRHLCDVGTGYSFDGRHGAAALNHLLDCGEEHLLERHLTGKAALAAGAALFEILFPADGRWRAVMRRFAGYRDSVAALVSPTQEYVRLRILTAAPEFLSLPWRLLSFEGHFLVDHGWTIEIVSQPTASAKVKLTIPAKLLILAPCYRGMADIGTARHVTALKDCMTRFAPSWQSAQLLRVVESRQKLTEALRGMQPDILYYYGHGGEHGGLPCLELGTPDDPCDPMLFADLQLLLRQSPPKLLFLNGCVASSSGWYGVGHQLSHRVPLVIAQRTTAYAGHAAATAQSFLQRCFIDGAEPVEAMHHLDDIYSRTDFQWCTSILSSHYAAFEVQVGHPAGSDERAPRRLDRRERKAMVDDYVTALLRSPDQRVQALVACAESNNLIDEFSWQCVDYLIIDKARRLLCIDAPLPLGSGQLGADLEAAMIGGLGADPGEHLGHALRRKLPRDSRLVWINFGVLHPREDTDLPIRRWLSWCCDRLVAVCPQDCRIVAYLGIELPKREHAEIAGLISDYQDQVRTTFAHLRFRCNALSPLPAVTQDDLFHFFDEPRNSSCPARLSRDAAAFIFLRSSGIYAEAVRLIELGESRKWDDDYFAALKPPARSAAAAGKKKTRSYD